MSAVNTGRYRPEKPAKKKFEPGGPKAEIPRENTIEGRIYQSYENIKGDALYGFNRVTDTKERIGFLINMHSTDLVDDEKRVISGVDFYFLEEDCSRFKVSLPYYSYFYIRCKKDTYEEVSTYLMKKYVGFIAKIESVLKEDLDLPNHLIGLKQKYLKLSFINTIHMMRVRKDILHAVRLNKERESSNKFYKALLSNMYNNSDRNYESKPDIDQLDNIVDIREYDVPHHIRVSIDLEICVGLWYNVKSQGTDPPIITKVKDMMVPPEPIVLAYDIETTKLPLKFPDASMDQIMMISYMIDGQGYLITNREIISSDIDDFEYTPKPEFEGVFKVFNEPNEKATISRFFDHINQVKPHIFVTYNGDFFDWPFVETRAAVHGMNMTERIGFSKNKDDVYISRAATHMDCLCWVKRDSYLPVGSQNLKAVAKAKLRYDPVELDPEDMCRFAVEEPEILANYSVSDAVATYYLYYKYVHPFIFALCTIIPVEPDEVLRKGSGTLCESLLMVEAFRANVIFPNKQEAQLNKLKDGHLLDSETYVGGHVEALESGVFRADIPYRFKIVPSAVDELINGVERALKHAITEEEKIPMDTVLNFEEICEEIRSKLQALKAQPLRLERPVIYHLDVGAMYPNIILTNRLQPSAMVDETICAACDYNRPNATCKRNMEWQWRGEVLIANLGEYQRVQQQLETEKFPPQYPNGPRRAFYQLSKQEQAHYQKTRLSEYCRKVYKKVKNTVTEIRTQTICQRENSFYVDTVRAFRDRRYEYKGMTKVAKKQVAEAIARNDAAEIKIAKSKEVLYDSLQLAHKCILNSFYGYVMRKGSRWFSMEMGGVVCHTGANIIMKAREIIENVGRPLELDTDGIWCILPVSFPDNVILKTTHPKKKEVTISYPNAILNYMVKDQFTNHAYHKLVDRENLRYEICSENSIFFEVDGPYLAMVLPASKEEGKKLKKRYAVFNFDGTLAELKGFEVKRRGELQLIKLFQSSVFDSFLKGKTLEECYASVASVANHWLDILHTKGKNLSDSELFELISENKSLSRQLDDYGGQKSTSISTAKRLAEFLGDQMIKDKGLACKYIISKKPEGAPVTERAIPLAIFQSEPSVTKHYLRKWLKDPSIDNFDLRTILDWSYYLERLGNTIQKIITIPAAMQGIANPVPRVRHPDWLHKKLLEKSDSNRQQKISDIFQVTHKTKTNYDKSNSIEIQDIEDSAGPNSNSRFGIPISTYNKRKRSEIEEAEDETMKTWKDVLGDPPPMGNSKEEFQAWLAFHKKKWKFQIKQRGPKQPKSKRNKTDSHHESMVVTNHNIARTFNPTTLSGFLRQAQRKLIRLPWQIIQLVATNDQGIFKAWILVEHELHQVRIEIPRIFYVNSRKDRPEPTENDLWVKCPGKILPRSRPVYHLFKYTCSEFKFQKYNQSLLDDLNKPDVEGIYETQMTLEFRAILALGCICKVRNNFNAPNTDTFHMNDLEYRNITDNLSYLKEEGLLKYIFLYQHWSSNHQRSVWGLFLTPTKKAYICIQDNVRTEKQIPNINNLYSNEKQLAMKQENSEYVKSYPDSMQFEVQIFTSVKQVIRVLQNALKSYKQEMKGATAIILQTAMDKENLVNEMPQLNDYPVINTHIKDFESLYTSLEWQKIGVTKMLRHYFVSDYIIQIMINQSNFLHVPIGNVPSDAALFGADLFYARLLHSNNYILWCSPTEKPDFGGSENDDNRLLTDFEENSSCSINNPGTYASISVELEVNSLAVNTLLQASHVHDVDGISSSTAFMNRPQLSLQEMVSEGRLQITLPSYDETALCGAAYKVLKSTITKWVQSVSQHGNIFADNLLMNFYRWLRSPSSLLYDPALRRTLHNDMKKLFIQLVAEFQRFGAIVVHANFNKLVLCTKKRSVKDAVDYITHVVKSINEIELFHSLLINYGKCWEYLVWLDSANYAGIKGKLPSEIQDETCEEEEEDEDEELAGVEMNWNLMEYLPKEGMCQQYFNTTIATFIYHVNNHIREIEPGNMTPRPRKRRNSTISQHSLTQQFGVGALDDAADFAKQLISEEISQKLFQIIGKIHKKVPTKKLNDEERARMSLHYINKKEIVPALELIKAICKVLSLDKGIEEEVYRMKSNLLRLIGVGQFSDEAEWNDPCMSFILPEVACQECNHIRDIDLCKDKYRSEEDRKLFWTCPSCQSQYNNEEIEYNLADILNRKMMAYTLQDLQCVKCLEIQMDNASNRCTCSGSYRTVVSKDEIIKFIKITKYLAMKCEMHVLNEALDNTGLNVN